MIFEKLLSLKEKFKSLFISKKKLKALENYSSCAPFKYTNSLALIKNCMEEGFLNDKGADFLTSMLDEYELNFLDWAHKTKWLKSKMKEVSREKYSSHHVQLSLFDFERKMAVPNIPIEILGNSTTRIHARNA